ncbi:MAG TPA: alkaline phosphatase family protein [Candidatus Cybelea sp.]|jgi:phospholipase C|nr:alkaline phosphatase family protein [Candidatus Cybelea sp.]
MKSLIRSRAALSVCAAAALLSGCGAQAIPYMQNGGLLQTLSGTGAGKIKHIVYIVQENRSFDNLFQGYPGANTVSEGEISTGKKVKLVPVGLAAWYVLDHSAQAMFLDCNAPKDDLPGTHCRMNGFNKEQTINAPKDVKYPEYVYVPHAESAPYFAMARQGALADNMFQSQLDESFIAHQYVIAAQANWGVDLPIGPWGCSSSGGGSVSTITKERTIGPEESACFDYTTLGDELDKAKLSWRFYAATYGSASSDGGAYWSGYQAVKHIYDGPDWKKDVISPNWKFITDVRSGYLANFTWITPECDDSDHVNCPDGYGPSWVSALVNTVGKSKFWDSTVIFIQWDDWGGLYDHVPPPYKDRDSLGFRVPLVMLSPYAISGHVSKAQYETASVLRFAEDLWGLKQMAAADRRATSPAQDNFNFNQQPNKFVFVKAPLPPKFFMHNRSANYFAPDYE